MFSATATASASARREAMRQRDRLIYDFIDNRIANIEQHNMRLKEFVAFLRASTKALQRLGAPAQQLEELASIAATIAATVRQPVPS